MRIAICDDEKNVRSYIRRLVEKQDGENSITEYASGEELLAAVKDEADWNIDLLFLDIAMGDIDGIGIAKKIRKMQTDRGQAVWGSLPLIIFVTGLLEYMSSAFFVHAYQFILKPIEEENFDNIFRQASDEYCRIRKKSNVGEKRIAIKNGGNSLTVKAESILYIESSNHNIIICLQNGRMEYYGRIGDLERELEPDFFRIHRGYLINLSCVDHYDRTDVYMDNGDRLPLSRYKYQSFVASYLRNISEGGE